MKSFLSCLILLSLLPTSTKAISWTDWEAKTPAGNTITDNWGPISLIVDDSTLIQDLNQWYFYKHNIIGVFGKETSYSKHFIFNEYVKSLEVFQSASEWNEQLKKRNLEPKIWTRWYYEDWDNFSILQVFILFGTIGLTRLFLSIDRIKNSLGINHLTRTIVFVSLIIVIIMKCLNAFPGSI